jgi:hypothetical protein
MNNKTPWDLVSPPKDLPPSKDLDHDFERLGGKKGTQLRFWKACRSSPCHLYSWILLKGCWSVGSFLPSFLSCKWRLMYVGSFLSLVASGDEFKANQLQIKHDLLTTRLLACQLTINHLICMSLWSFALLSKPYFVHVDMSNIYIHFSSC